MQRQIDPMVRHPALREVVGADAFAAVTAADHRFTCLSLCALRLVALFFVNAGAQHLHRFFLVLMLAAAILTSDDDAGRRMGYAHGRVSGVDMLPASAGCAIDIDLQVAVLDMDIDFGGFGQHRDGRGAGVYAATGFGNRHTLHPVDTAFKFQPRKYPSARY